MPGHVFDKAGWALPKNTRRQGRGRPYQRTGIITYSPRECK